MYSVFLKKGEEKRILAGHPFVYANEVSKIEGKDVNGSLSTVYSFDGKFIGKGYINHLSKILVRIFIRDDVEDTVELISGRLKRANDMRLDLGYSNAYRLCYAEADYLPGLIVDKYDTVLCVQFLSLGMDKRKKEIVDILVDLFSPTGIYERSDVKVREKEGLPESVGVLYGEVPDRVVIEENGVKMSVDVRHGQKTGYFLDQKENRYAVRRYAQGKAVLDLFCNSGGFSMNAALTAKEVTAVDISETAIASVRENAALNGLNNVTAVTDDVFDALRRYKREGKKFGLVILDPPAFCKSASEVRDALRGYKDINVLGMKLVESGGYLVSSSCTHFVTRQMFEKMLTDSARESGRKVRRVEIKSQAPDHPTLMSEGSESDYLKFYVMRIDD